MNVPLLLSIVFIGSAFVWGGCKKDREKRAADRRRPELGKTKTRLAPGVLAEVSGRQGLIQVRERAGRRELIIDGVVHASVRSQEDPLSARVDPLVELIRALKSGFRDALVIGLGSGRTAAQLAAGGVKVEVVELEPGVIEFARKYFHYEGHAEAGDGLGYLKSKKKQYDVIVMDAFFGTRPPMHLVSPDALALMRKRTRKGGVVAFRLLGCPYAQSVQTLFGNMQASMAGGRVSLYGSGVGNEKQNLYLVFSPAPNLARVSGLAAWPIPEMRDIDGEVRLPLLTPGGPHGGGKRKVVLAGYLARVGPQQKLCLDLPHAEMGAQRYLLTGPHAIRLDARVPRDLFQAKNCDLREENECGADKTLRGLLGGGEVMRSDTRLTPICAVVRGVARLRAVIDPDLTTTLPKGRARPTRTTPFLPRGGVLYELTLTEPARLLDLKTWRAWLRKTAVAVSRAVARRNLSDAADELKRHLDNLKGRFGVLAPRLSGFRKLQTLRKTLVAGLRDADPTPTPQTIGRICDRCVKKFPNLGPDLDPARKAFKRCAKALKNVPPRPAGSDRM